MKKKLIIGIFGLVLTGVLLLGVVPVAAADGPATTPPSATQQIGKGQLLRRILSIQDQAKLESLLAQGVANGKITADQSAKIEAFWTAHHAQFKGRVIQRILNVKDEAKLKAFLDKAVSNGKITAAQESNIISLWESAHNK